jgi:hypothetical protein
MLTRVLSQCPCPAFVQPIGSEEEGEKEPSHKKLTELFRLANVAIPMSYFSIGIALTFISTPAMYYAVDTLDADSAVVNTLNCVQVCRSFHTHPTQSIHTQLNPPT